MKSLKAVTDIVQQSHNVWEKIIPDLHHSKMKKQDAIKMVVKHYSTSDKYVFYPAVGELLSDLGLRVNVTRDGDTNNRSDAIIIDSVHSMPIEIKSPTEVANINFKSIRQALENKIVLLSRNFYPTTKTTTSFAVGFYYPEKRSGVKELIEDIFNTYGFNIGYLAFEDLLDLNWDCVIEGSKFDFIEHCKNLRGQFLK